MSILRTGPRPPRHVEIWGELEQSNRFLRRLVVAASIWAFVALAGAAYALDLALFHPVAFHVDGDGRSTYLGRVRENAAPTDAEVRHVAKQFLSHYAAWNSLTVESDLAAAWNLMTNELRTDHEKQLADYRRANQRDFVAFVKEQGIQTLLDLPSEKLRISEHNGQVWTVRLLGSARTWPLSRIGDPSAVNERDLEAIVTLVRCPRTEQTPNGLLVAKVSTRFFVADASSGGPPQGSPPSAPAAVADPLTPSSSTP